MPGCARVPRWLLSSSSLLFGVLCLLSLHVPLQSSPNLRLCTIQERFTLQWPLPQPFSVLSKNTPLFFVKKRMTKISFLTPPPFPLSSSFPSPLLLSLFSPFLLLFFLFSPFFAPPLLCFAPLLCVAPLLCFALLLFRSSFLFRSSPLSATRCAQMPGCAQVPGCQEVRIPGCPGARVCEGVPVCAQACPGVPRCPGARALPGNILLLCSWCEWKYQLVGWSNTSGCVLSSVSIAANSATTDCFSGLCIQHGGASSTPACRLRSQDQANVCTKHHVAIACRRVVGHWRSCWLSGWLHLSCYRQVIAGRKGCSMFSNGLAITQDDPDCTELFGCGSTSHVCGFGLCRVGKELIHGPFDLQGAPAVVQERPPVVL